ncbi:MAG: hypothetical protein IK104_01005 [Clostridia bacterium]|nr:hypothetical protein [Clostridia bacterium]
MSDRELIELLSSLEEANVERIVSSDIDYSSDAAFTERICASVLSRAGEKGRQSMKPIKNKKRFIAILAAAVLVALTATGVAASRFFKLPIDYDNVKDEVGLQLSENLQRVVTPEAAEAGDIVVANKTVTTDDYTFTLEGIIRASQYRNISIDGEHLEGDVDGFYAVVTVARSDGGVIFMGDDEKSFHGATIGAAPLIHGVKPNINTYGLMTLERETGVPVQYVENNVLYLFVDITDFMCFADKGLSLAVYGTMIYTAEEIGLDENGVPCFTEKARAPYAMFELPVDASFADAAAQEALIASRPFEWATKLPYVYGE